MPAERLHECRFGTRPVLESSNTMQYAERTHEYGASCTLVKLLVCAGAHNSVPWLGGNGAVSR